MRLTCLIFSVIFAAAPARAQPIRPPNGPQAIDPAVCLPYVREWISVSQNTEASAIAELLRSMPAECANLRSAVRKRLRTLLNAPAVLAARAAREGRPIAERVFRDMLPSGAPCDTCPQIVAVPPGAFTMGSPAAEQHRDEDEGPQHVVTISAFAVSQSEITFDDWDRCRAGGGCQSNPTPPDYGQGRGNRPVVNVTWHDATQYAAWLSMLTGQEYRLLTEAEWEYAARAVTSPTATYTTFSWGNAYPVCSGNALNGAAASDVTSNCPDDPYPVGSFLPNAFGLYDMHGNVWEYVQDCYMSSYNGAPTDGSPVEYECSNRVMRGGSFLAPFHSLRSASRASQQPDSGASNQGVRIARSLVQ